MQTTSDAVVARAAGRAEVSSSGEEKTRQRASGAPGGGSPLVPPEEDGGRSGRQDAAGVVLFRDLMDLVLALADLLDMWPALPAAEAAELAPRLSDPAARLTLEIQAERDRIDAERGEIVVQRVPLDAGEVAADVVRSLERHAASEGLRLELRVPGEPRILLSDRLLLRRVLGILMENALRASAPGDTVELVVEDPGDAAVFHVRNPRVMPDAVQAQIFERSRPTPGPRHAGPGTYSVKLLTERYLGGSVRFVSEPARGTVFSVRLPLG